MILDSWTDVLVWQWNESTHTSNVYMQIHILYGGNIRTFLHALAAKCQLYGSSLMWYCVVSKSWPQHLRNTYSYSSPTSVAIVLIIRPWPICQQRHRPNWTTHNSPPRNNLREKLHHGAAYTWHRRISFMFIWMRHENIFPSTSTRVSANYKRIASCASFRNLRWTITTQIRIFAIWDIT